MDTEKIIKSFLDSEYESATQIYWDAQWGMVEVVVFYLTEETPKIEFRAHPASRHAMSAFDTLKEALEWLRDEQY